MIRQVPPSIFSFVMATAIVGTAFATIGHPAVAVAALPIAAVGSVVLILALVARAVLAPDALRRDVHDPGRAIGCFTIVAGGDVTATLAAELGMR